MFSWKDSISHIGDPVFFTMPPELVNKSALRSVCVGSLPNVFWQSVHTIIFMTKDRVTVAMAATS
jgi:hypothetical protein